MVNSMTFDQRPQTPDDVTSKVLRRAEIAKVGRQPELAESELPTDPPLDEQDSSRQACLRLLQDQARPQWATVRGRRGSIGTNP